MRLKHAQIQGWTSPLEEYGRKKMKKRDGRVGAILGAFRSLTREQIQILLFDFPTGKTKCRQRLAALTRAGKVKRGRSDLTRAYCYWLAGGEKPKQMEHLLLRNWVIVRLLPRLLYCDTEYITPYVRPDALLITTGGVFFLEAQRNVAKFDKVPKYEALFQDHAAWVSGSWAGIGQKKQFPSVLVITDGSAEALRNRIEADSTLGLRFKVYSLEEVVRGEI